MTDFHSEEFGFSTTVSRAPRRDDIPEGADPNVLASFSFHEVGAEGAISVCVERTRLVRSVDRREVLISEIQTRLSRFGVSASTFDIDIGGETCSVGTRFKYRHPELGACRGRVCCVLRERRLYALLWISSLAADCVLQDGDALIDSFETLPATPGWSATSSPQAIQR